jgi:hypothetical protein
VAFFETTPLPLFENANVEFSEPPSVDRIGSISSILGLIMAAVAYRRSVANAHEIAKLEGR